MKLSLNRLDKKIGWLDRETVGRLRRAAAGLDPVDAVVEVTVVDDEYIRELNRGYRGADRPTDVISFSYLDDVDDERTPGEIDQIAGEIYISFETVQAKARKQGIAPEHLFLRIGVHGFLHVLGYVHDTDPDFEKMEAEEKRLLLDYLSPAEVEELF